MSDNKHMEMRKQRHQQKNQKLKSIQIYDRLLAIEPQEHVDDYLWRPLAKAFHTTDKIDVDQAVRLVGMVFCGQMMKIMRRYDGELIQGSPGSEATPILLWVMTHLRLERNKIFSILLADEELGAQAADQWWAEFEDAPIW